MTVLSVPEQGELEAVPVRINMPRPRSATQYAAAVGRQAAASATRRRAGSAHSSARAGTPPGARELHIRAVRVSELQVSELQVSELRAGERQAAGVSARRVRGREVRSVTVRARETGSIGVRGTDLRGTDLRRGAQPHRRRPGDDVRGGPRGAAGPGRPEPGDVGRLRLTRRGRAVLAALAIATITALVTVILLVLSAAGGAQAASHGSGPVTAHQGLSQVVVQPGQTLWSIARRAEPAADPRMVVQQIIDVNALSSPMIEAGELLWVPRG